MYRNVSENIFVTKYTTKMENTQQEHWVGLFVTVGLICLLLQWKFLRWLFFEDCNTEVEVQLPVIEQHKQANEKPKLSQVYVHFHDFNDHILPSPSKKRNYIFRLFCCILWKSDTNLWLLGNKNKEKDGGQRKRKSQLTPS